MHNRRGGKFKCLVQLLRLLSLWSFGKCLSTRARNLRPIMVLTFLLNGGFTSVVPFFSFGSCR